MPKCSVCRRSFPRTSDLARVRHRAGKLVFACKRCVTAEKARRAKSQVAVNQTPERSPGERSGAAAKPHSPSSRQPRALQRRQIEETKKAFVKIHETLQSLKREKKEPKAASDKRAHERHRANFKISFSLLRDDAVHTCDIRDISRGGVRFITPVPLAVGNILQADIQAPEGSPVKIMIKRPLEVRRITPLKDGRIEVGARFVSHVRASEPNRRRYRRRPVDMAVQVRRDGCEYITIGRVRDISQGGARLIMDEAPDVGEKIQVTLRGGKNAHFHSAMEVIRVQERRPREYELGCRFITPDAEPPK